MLVYVRSNPNNAMAQLAMGMLCVVYTALITPFSIEQEYVTPCLEHTSFGIIVVQGHMNI